MGVEDRATNGGDTVADQTEIGIGDVLKLTGVGKATIYRWMNRHPTMRTGRPDSLGGHPFPKPLRKKGREVLWDKSVVESWWTANKDLVGRHPDESNIIIMPWPKFREAMLKRPRLLRMEDGSEVIEDDMDMVESFDRKLDDVRVRFRSVEDAVWFKLKYR